MRLVVSLSVLLLVAILTGYVCSHLWRIVPGGVPWKATVVGLFVLWVFGMFAGFLLMEHLPVKLAVVQYEVGNTWLIAFLYLFLLCIFADTAVLLHLLPKEYLRDSALGLGVAAGILTLIIVFGGIHYHHKYRVEMTVSTQKPLEKPHTIVLASDLHLGYHNRKAELARWVDIINTENPDLVLFGGDIVDMSLRPVLEGNYGEEFRRIGAPAYTVLGNHEYYGDRAGAEKFFEESGIQLLKDTVVRFQGVDIIGRNDRTNRGRADLATLAEGLEGFTLLLDHQPNDLEEAEDLGIDFQFSGHTHRGQVWPISWITEAIFDVAWGPAKRGNTQYYVSSGLGIWGPKVRIGTRSEYLVLHIEPEMPLED